MKAAVYFCTSLSLLPSSPPRLKHIHLAVTKGLGYASIYGHDGHSRTRKWHPQLRGTASVQAATAGRSPRDKPCKILAQLTHPLGLSSLYYRFTVYAAPTRRTVENAPPPPEETAH